MVCVCPSLFYFVSFKPPCITSSTDDLLIRFCTHFETLYGKERCTPNMQMHCHLCESVLDVGPVYSFWCFSFEPYNGIWKECKYLACTWSSTASQNRKPTKSSLFGYPTRCTHYCDTFAQLKSVKHKLKKLLILWQLTIMRRDYFAIHVLYVL